MEFLKGAPKTQRLELKDILGGAHRNETVQVAGMVHARQTVGGGLTFLKLRKRDGILQCTCAEGVDVSGVPEEAAVVVTGTLREEPRAPGGWSWRLRLWRSCPGLRPPCRCRYPRPD